MNATNLTDTTWYDESAPKGERHKPRPRLLQVQVCNTPGDAEGAAFAMRSLGDRRVNVYVRTIKAGGVIVTVRVVVSREKGTKRAAADQFADRRGRNGESDEERWAREGASERP